MLIFRDNCGRITALSGPTTRSTKQPSWTNAFQRSTYDETYLTDPIRKVLRSKTSQCPGHGPWLGPIPGYNSMGYTDFLKGGWHQWGSNPEPHGVVA